MEQKSASSRHLLAIGIDDRVFTQGSEMHEKALAYGKDFATAHIVCRSRTPAQKREVVGNIIFYPVQSRQFWMFPFLAWHFGKKIVRSTRGQWLVSSDTPFEMGLVSWALARYARGALLVQVHTDFLSSYFRYGSLKEQIRYWMGRFVVPRATCVRVVSERIKKSLIDAHCISQSASVTVLPIATEVGKFFNAIPDPFVEKRFSGYVFKMIAVGRFVEKEKNFIMLIAMMRDFIKICPQALLVIVGDGPDTKEYEARIRNYGLEKYVILEPWRDDLASLYKSFDLFLLSSNYEGWGRVVIEAMAAGLPVVMTDVGLAGEVVRDGTNGIIVPVGDVHACLNACISLFRDPEKRKLFARKGQDTASEMASAHNQDVYTERYRKTLLQCGA